MDHDELASFVLQQMARIPPPMSCQADNPRPIMAIVDNLKDCLTRCNPRSSAPAICLEHFTAIGWQWEQNKPGTESTSIEDCRRGLQAIADTLRNLPRCTDRVGEVEPARGQAYKPGVPAVKVESKKRPPKRPKDVAVDKASKGLRHLSLRVCQKVEHKGRTTYGEVADELVSEILGESAEEDQSFDEKNIRRRVYDALNVLLAMDMIMKDKKEISWIGLPSHTQVGLDSIRARKEDKIESINRKRARHAELCEQMAAYKRVIRRNTQQGPVAEEKRIHMPFIVVKTSKQNNIDCEVTEDYQEIFFNFSSDFEILNDMEILKKMGMHLPEEPLAALPVPNQLEPIPQAQQVKLEVPPSELTLTTGVNHFSTS
eukprot:TRINITY_DN4994_c0_g1_i4.p1 TRINITY_DN4994_c0_g1~~TRINITY_DN4994_c0_g1_i4.p1  ORF type:complete len:372 (-),score=58.72 TRINITY_DN4994_c0_g1_i4:25-1140(-)